MSECALYHDGNRQLQDQFGSRELADRLEAKLARTEFTPDDKAFIESQPYFFLATADADGRPDCSFKGGMPGFVRVIGAGELAFPDYDGNGMFKSLGNLLVNPNVGMLFIAMHDKPQRLRVNGTAAVSRDDPLLAYTVGAQMIVRVTARAIFPNCPRYIPTMELVEPSTYAPQPGCQPPEPAWKDFDMFKDVVPPRQPTFGDKARRPIDKEATVPHFPRGTDRQALNGSLDSLLQAHMERWLEENRDAIESSNAHVEAHGLPLARHRRF